jgi:MFS family permease
MSRRWIILALVFFGIVISYIDRGNLGIAAPAIMRDFSLEPSRMGVLLSAFFWTYAVFQIPAGFVVDRFGIRLTYATGFLLWSLASAAIALSRGAGDVIGLRMVLGLAESVGPLASVAFIHSHIQGKDRRLPTSIYVTGQSIGPAMGALIGTILLDRFGWRTMFALTGLGALVWLPCWLLAVPSDETRVPREAEKAADISSLVGSRPFWALSFAILGAAYYWYFVLTWIPTYLTTSRGFSTTEMGRIISAGLFTMAVTNVMSGYAADRLTPRWGVFRVRMLFAAAGYIGTAAILLLLVLKQRAWILPVLTFAMCATGAGNSSFWTLAQQVSPKNMAGRTIGYLNTLAQVAGAVAPVLTGFILGPEKHFGPAILVAGLCPVFAALCLLGCGSKAFERATSQAARPYI